MYVCMYTRSANAYVMADRPFRYSSNPKKEKLKERENVKVLTSLRK